MQVVGIRGRMKAIAELEIQSLMQSASVHVTIAVTRSRDHGFEAIQRTFKEGPYLTHEGRPMAAGGIPPAESTEPRSCRYMPTAN